MIEELPGRLNEIEIPVENPFLNDRLDREKYADTLTAVVKMHAASGCVLSINGDWGTGKTTFVKMWQAKMVKDGYKTVYFNAWETDYFTDPLTAILGEMKDIFGDKPEFKNVISSVGKIAVKTGKALSINILNKQFGIDSDIIKAAAEGIESEISDKLDDYKKEKETLSSFKSSLANYIAGEGAFPLVFIVDELDRCNPHYAVKVLETIKHLFDIPNIVFVLSVSKEQLEASIKGFYGSSEINASKYLLRFIDLQFDLPQPNGDKFCELLFDNYNYSEYFDSSKEFYNGVAKDDEFKEFSKFLFNSFNLDLRAWDKIYENSRLTAIQLGGNNRVVIELVFLLCFLKIQDNRLYNEIREKRISTQELVNRLEGFFPRNALTKPSTWSSDSPYYSVIYILSELLFTYDYSINERKGPIHSIQNKDDELNLSFNIIDKEQVKSDIISIPRCMHIDKDITYFTNKVDLTETFSKK